MTALKRRYAPSEWHWIWRTVIAGLCGAIAHLLLMYFKSRAGLLPSFQPYHTLQMRLGNLTGAAVHPVVPWAISFLNGSIVINFIFRHIYRRLPSNSSAIKGIIFGVLGWVIMGLVFFPLIGLGIFGLHVALGILPALFSLAMLLTYSIVMALVYDALNP